MIIKTPKKAYKKKILNIPIEKRQFLHEQKFTINKRIGLIFIKI